MIVAASRVTQASLPSRRSLLTCASPDRFTPSDPVLDPCRQLRSLAAASPSARLDSMEFKMLLDPSRFQDPHQGRKQFLDLLDSAAAAQGLTWDRSLDLTTKTRDLRYLDTPDFSLRQQGYILRQRSRSKADTIMTLKFRDRDRARAAASDVSSPLEGEQKFEKDVTFQAQDRSLFSRSNKIRMNKPPTSSVRGLAEVYPTLGQLGLDPQTPLKAVQGRRITEEEHDLGELKVGPEESVPMQLTLWFEKDQPVIAEFSFRLEGQGMTAESQANRLMNAVRSQGPGWVGTGSTKTDYVYSKP